MQFQQSLPFKCGQGQLKKSQNNLDSTTDVNINTNSGGSRRKASPKSRREFEMEKVCKAEVVTVVDKHIEKIPRPACKYRKMLLQTLYL